MTQAQTETSTTQKALELLEVLCTVVHTGLLERDTTKKRLEAREEHLVCMGVLVQDMIGDLKRLVSGHKQDPRAAVREVLKTYEARLDAIEWRSP